MVLKKLIMEVATALESEACQAIIRQITSKIGQKLVTELGMRAVVAGVAENMAGVLAAMGPIGWVIDGLMLVFTIVAIVYNHYDPHNYSQTYFRETIENMLRDIEDSTKYETYKFAKSMNRTFDYPIELNGTDLFDEREWKYDVQKLLMNSLSYGKELVANLYRNSRGEIIDLQALCETDENIDRSLITHPPSWNTTIQRSVETVISSQERAHAIQHELEENLKLWDGLAPVGWISLLTVGCTVAFYELTKPQINSTD
uniref:Uncharacterized protein U22 n=1 Tax=Hyposoter didymator TaxID=260305 RepID=D7P5Q3_HYPDD|nr:unknown [Hyposoter didymator]